MLAEIERSFLAHQQHR